MGQDHEKSNNDKNNWLALYCMKTFDYPKIG